MAFRGCVAAVLALLAPPFAQAALTVSPLGETSWLEVRHPDLPEGAFQLRLPEHILTLEGMVADHVRWQRVDATTWRLDWEADEPFKRRWQTDFHGVVRVGKDCVDVTWTILNPTAEPWPTERYNAFDFLGGALARFHDTEGKRTYVYVKDRFVNVNEALKGQFSPDLTGWMVLAKDRANPQSREYTERVMARTSADGDWVMAIASDVGNGATFNLQPAATCLHQNMTWGQLQPHQERTIRVRAHVMRGGLEDFRTRFLADKEAWGEPGDPQTAKPTGPVDLGYIPTVWAPASRCGALEALRKLRSARFRADPVARWVEDRLARDSGTTPSGRSVSEALLALRRVGAFRVRDDASGLWVTNGLTGLALLPGEQGAGVASLYGIDTATECILQRPEAQPPWRLVLLRRWAPETPAPLETLWPPKGGGLTALREVDGGALPAHWQTRAADDRFEVKVTWEPVRVPETEDAFEVSATMTLRAESPLIGWRVSVRRTAGDGYRLAAVRFPVLRGLGSPADHDIARAWGTGRGQLYRARIGAWGDDGHVYPGGNWSVQHLSMSFGGACLYLACHDTAGYTKTYRIAAGSETYFTHIAWSPDGLELPYEVAIGPLRGDWFDAARLYRRWATKQPWCARGPLWRRVQQGDVARHLVEADMWVRPDWAGDRFWTTGEEQLKANVEWLGGGGTCGLGVWWYGWATQGFDRETPVFTARPEASGVLKRNVADGLSVLPYVQCGWWDVDAPPFDGAAQAAAVKLMKGSPRTDQYASTMAQMCLSQRLSQDTAAHLAEYVAGLGSNGVYLDTFPGYADCWDPSHGHPVGAGGDWHARSVREILSRIKHERGPGFGLTMEYLAEPYFDLCDAQMSWSWIEETDCPLVPAVYSGYAVVSGAATHGDYPDDPVSFRIKLGRCFLWGSQLGRGMYSEYLSDERKSEFLCNLARLKARARKFLTYGEMLRPPTLAGDVPRVTADDYTVIPAHLRFTYDAVEAALWRAPDGALGLALVNYDSQPHTVEFLWPSALGSRKWRGDILEATGERPWAESISAGDAARFHLDGGQALTVVLSSA
jgi:hypothetical protein